MTQGNAGDDWQVRLVSPLRIWGKKPVRPADVSNGLCAAMLDRQGVLEDVSYAKIVPNRYIVEVNERNYDLNYRPIERRVLQQWSERLMSFLMNTNSRLGRKEYRFSGRVQVEIRPVSNLEPNQVRILSRVEPEGGMPASRKEAVRKPDQQPQVQAKPVVQLENLPPEAARAQQMMEPSALDQTSATPRPKPDSPCIELPDGRRWPIMPGQVTLGRNKSAKLWFDMPEVHDIRLVSGLHAYIINEGGRCRIFDGSPDGKPSLNGTFVNRKPVLNDGALLTSGDQVILAALDANNPQADIPGVVSFTFIQECA